MPELGLGNELRRLNFGGDLADALSKIGQGIRESKLQGEARKTLADLTGVDLSTPEGMQQFRKSIFSLSQMEGPGKTALGAVEQGVVEPMQLQQQIETQKINRLKTLKEPYERMLNSYFNKMSIPGLDPTALHEDYSQLVAQRNKMLPLFKDHEEMLDEVPHPVALRMMPEEKIIATPVVMNDGFYHYRVQNTKTGLTEDRVWGKAPPAKTGGEYQTTGADYSLTGEDFLNSISDERWKNLVKGVRTYQVDPARVTSFFRGVDRERLIGDVLQYSKDPVTGQSDWDMTMYDTRHKARQEFATGKAAQNIRSLNTAIGHVNSLHQAGLELSNLDLRAINSVKNWFATSTGDPRVRKFREAATAVSDELAALFKNTGATDVSIQAWKEAFSSSDSPEQIDAAIKKAVELMRSRLSVLNQQWSSVMGAPKDFQILYPESRLILSNLGIDPSEFEHAQGKLKEQNDPYKVGQIYIDAKGNRAKYLGNNKWEDQK